MSLGIYSVAVTLIAIMLSVSGIVLGIGYAMDDRKLKEFGRSEIYQSIINGVIVGTLIVAFGTGGFFSVLINNIAGNAHISATCEQSMSGNSAICFAYNYLVGLQPVTINGASLPTLMSTSVGLLTPISLLYAGLSLLSSIKLSFFIVSLGFADVLNPIITALQYIIEILTAAIIGIEVQGVLLKFISVIAMPVLLPVGIVLRTAYVTRRLGGAVMAIAIGLFAVFPLTYILNASLASNYLSNINNGTINTFITTEISANHNIINTVTSINGNSKNVTGIVNFTISSVNALISGFGNFLNQLTNYVALIVIEVFFLPVFSIILTAISIRELARILGSEISFGRLFIF